MTGPVPIRTLRHLHRWAAASCAAALLCFVAPPGARAQDAQNPDDSTRVDAPTSPDDGMDADTSFGIVPLAPLVVTGERRLSAPPPIAVTRVEPELVHQTPAANPYDLVRRVADVEIHEQGQGPGFASDAVVRGFTSDHSGDVLLVIDGVPVNLPIMGHGEGYADWNVLLAPAVADLRLIHGTASPLYGNFALGGVLEVYTSPDADHTAGGAFGTSDADAGGWLRTGRHGDDGGFMVAGEGRRQQGWRDNSDYWLGNTLVRGWRSVGDHGRLEGGLSLYGSDWDSPGFVSVERYNADRLTAASDPTDGGDTRRGVLYGHWSTHLTPDLGLHVGGWGMASRWRLYLTLPEGDTASQVGERDARVAGGTHVELSLRRPWGELTGGVEGRADRASYWQADTEARDVQGVEADLDAGYFVGAAFIRWRRVFAQKVGVDVGGRVDGFRYASRDYLDETTGWRDATSWVASPKVGLRWLLSPNLALFGSSSRGFRGAVGVVGDPSRPPILAWAHEVGVRVDRAPIDATLSLFRMDVTNERTQDPVTMNITSEGGSVRQGVDLDVAWTLGDAVRFKGAVTWNHARLTSPYADAHDDTPGASVASAARVATRPRGGDVAVATPALDLLEAQHDEADAGDRVPGVAEYVASFGADVRLPWRDASADAAVRVTGPYVPIGEPGIRTQAYSVLDLGGAVGVGRGATLRVSVENALDIRYAELRASGFINPGRPRTLRVGVSVE